MSNELLDARKLNIIRSPKKGGSSDIDSIPYLNELHVDIIENRQPIQFAPNNNEYVHRWGTYVQGFSASFVQSVFNQYKTEYINPVVMDPFAGSGTVLVQAKLNGYRSTGTELNPLLHFIANTKLNCWDVSPEYLLKIYNSIPMDKRSSAPGFLRSYSQFNKEVLRNLEILKAGIESLDVTGKEQRKVIALLRLAFSSIIVDCSNLKRSPCLGYCSDKKIDDETPFILFEQRIHQIIWDLRIIQSHYKKLIETESKVILANAMDYHHDRKFDLIITSPPYMNGLDYVMNYKIEMGWLGFIKSHKESKKIKDAMVVCDNVSKGLIKDFTKSPSIYTNDWIEKIKIDIEENIAKRGSYRRNDMPHIVHKYFDDMYMVMSQVVTSINPGGRFILVIGDSLIADVYVPTDLLVARIGLDLGFEIEKIEKARDRRSGQIRSYRLRESIVTLIKR
jgi:16S rRNA G966 N2-methylase RsmD